VNLSLRGRLTLWFILVMAVSLAVFGALTYTSIDRQLKGSLDISLDRVISSLAVIINKQAEKPQRPPEPPPRKRRDVVEDTVKDELAFLRNDSLRRDSLRDLTKVPHTTEAGATKAVEEAKKVDPVWTEIYEYMVLNPRKTLIQVMDTTGTIVYRSKNLIEANDSLHLPGTVMDLAHDTVSRFALISQTVLDTTSGPQMIRIAIARSRSAILVAGYPLNEVQGQVEEFFSTLVLLIPLVLILSTIGGFFLAKASLRPVDEITRTAQEITASNLSRRLPVPSTNDEVARLSDTLNDMISRLENSFERVRQFSADASHELRTPLTILTGELELALRSRKTPEEYQDVISSALQEVLRLSRVVEYLLLLARADTGQLSLHFEPTNLTEMLADLADAAMILGGPKSIYISFRANEDLIVNADRAQLSQMFLNLVDNAVKYTPEGGLISLTVHRDKDFAEVRVRDTGIGINSEHQKKIFDRFYRVDKARSREMGGVGLGLSIVQWTVQAHNGMIWVESEPGQGSTFIVRLPLPQEPPRPEDADGIAKSRSRTHAFDVKKFLKRPRADHEEEKTEAKEELAKAR